MNLAIRGAAPPDHRMGGSGRVASLQLLRFVAATMVVFHHSITLARGYSGSGGVLDSGRLFDFGGIGVDIFFVISGFVITLSGPLARRRPTAAEFYLRRWARVAPLFYILTIPILLTWQFRTPVSPWGAGRPITLPQMVATICFWPSAGALNVPPAMSDAWTLCFEMFFYSVMAVVLIGGRVRLMVGAVLVSVVVLTVLRSRLDIPALQFMNNKISLEFCIGVGLAVFRREIESLGPGRGLLLTAVGAACLLLWGFGFGPGVAGYDQVMADQGVLGRVLLIGLPAGLIVAGVVAADAGIQRRRELFDRLGDASYAIFLSHGFTLIALYITLRALGAILPPSAITLGAVAVSLCLGYWAYYLVDRPIMAYFRTRIPKVVTQPPRLVPID